MYRSPNLRYNQILSCSRVFDTRNVLNSSSLPGLSSSIVGVAIAPAIPYIIPFDRPNITRRLQTDKENMDINAVSIKLD